MRRHKWLYRLSLLTLGLALLLSACARATPSPTPAPVATPAPTPTPVVRTPIPTPTPAPTPPPVKIKLTVAGFFAPDHVATRAMELFVQKVAEYTNGQVTAEHHPGGALVKGRDMLTAGKTGVADVVSVITTYYPGDLPFAADVGALPFLWSKDNVDKAMDVLRPYYEEEFLKSNLQPLWMSGFVTEWFFKKPVDADNPDWKGRKVRTIGGPITKMIEILGGTPVSMASDEVPLAIATGTIDGFLTSLGTYGGWDLYKDAPHILVTGANISLVNVLSMNLDTWKKMPAHIQQAVLKAAKDSETWLLANTFKYDEPIIEKAKLVAKPVFLTPEQRNKWRLKLQPVFDDFVKKHGERGTKVLADLAKLP